MKKHRAKGSVTAAAVALGLAVRSIHDVIKRDGAEAVAARLRFRAAACAEEGEAECLTELAAAFENDPTRGAT